MLEIILEFGKDGQIIRTFAFAILLLLAIRDFYRGNNGITKALILISAGNLINGIVSVFTPYDHLTLMAIRFIISIGAWLMGIGASWIVVILIRSEHAESSKGQN